jgi:hypothetical protein
LNPVHGKKYSIQHYVIKFFSDLQQASAFLQVLWKYDHVGKIVKKKKKFSDATKIIEPKLYSTVKVFMLKITLAGDFSQCNTECV